MSIAEIDAQIAQLKARRAKLIAKRQQERQAQRAAHDADRRPLSEWIYFDEHGLPRRTVSLTDCRRYAVRNSTKLEAILFAAERAGVVVSHESISEVDGSGSMAHGKSHEQNEL